MSTQPDPGRAPQTDCQAQSPGPTEACFEQMLSEAQAVEHALAHLGRGAPAADVRRLLGERGLDVPESVIEKVRAQLPPERHGG